MTNKFCSVRLCFKNILSNPNTNFFPFPDEAGQCQKWIEFSKSKINPCLAEDYYMCQDHFEKYMFEDSDKANLRDDAVPSIKTKFSYPRTLKKKPNKRPSNSQIEGSKTRAKKKKGNPKESLQPTLSESNIVQIENVFSLKQKDSPNALNNLKANSRQLEKSIASHVNNEKFKTLDAAKKKLENLVVFLNNEIKLMKTNLELKDNLVQTLKDKNKDLEIIKKTHFEFVKNYRDTLSFKLLQQRKILEDDRKLELEEKRKDLAKQHKEEQDKLGKHWSIKLEEQRISLQRTLNMELRKQQNQFDLDMHKKLSDQSLKHTTDLKRVDTKHKEELKTLLQNMKKMEMDHKLEQQIQLQENRKLFMGEMKDKLLQENKRFLEHKVNAFQKRMLTMESGLNKKHELALEELKLQYLEQKDLAEKYKKELQDANSVDYLLNRLSEYLPKENIKIIEKQMIMTQTKVPKELKLLALSIYIQSPVLYRQLKNVLHLPTEDYLNNILSNPEKSGIDSKLLKQNMNPYSREY